MSDFKYFEGTVMSDECGNCKRVLPFGNNGFCPDCDTAELIAELRAEVDEARKSLAEISELVGPGGDNTPIGRVESMLSTLTAERNELRDNARRAMRVAWALTQETQTVEDAVTDLVRQVREARVQRDEALAALRRMVASATPHPVEHPSMTAAWKVAGTILAKYPEGPCSTCGKPGDEVTRELDELVDRMQTPGARKAARKLFEDE